MEDKKRERKPDQPSSDQPRCIEAFEVDTITKSADGLPEGYRRLRRGDEVEK